MSTDRVQMHHPETKAQREFAPRTVEAWKRAGWVEGELPETAGDQTATGDAPASPVDEADGKYTPDVDAIPTAAGKTAAKK
jgi:hypothetical protein